MRISDCSSDVCSSDLIGSPIIADPRAAGLFPAAAILAAFGALTGIDADRRHRARQPLLHRVAHVGGRQRGERRQVLLVLLDIVREDEPFGQRRALAAEAAHLLDLTDLRRYQPGDRAVAFRLLRAVLEHVGPGPLIAPLAPPPPPPGLHT